MVGNMIFAMPFFSDPWVMVWFLTLPITIGLFFLTEYSPIKIENSVTESGHALGLFFYALIWTILIAVFAMIAPAGDPKFYIWIVALAIVPMVYGDGFNIVYIIVISAVATVCEALSYGGIDNLTVPALTSILYYLVAVL